MLELYKRIRERREELHISQEDLARTVGYKSRTSIHKIEMGMTDLSQSKIMEIADALSTTPEYLMGWTDYSPPHITEEEFELLECYRRLTPEKKQLVKGVVFQFDDQKPNKITANVSAKVINGNVQNSGGTNIVNVGSGSFNSPIMSQ